MAELGLDPQVMSFTSIKCSYLQLFHYFFYTRSVCCALPSCLACATRSPSHSGRVGTACTNMSPMDPSTKSSPTCPEGEGERFRIQYMHQSSSLQSQWKWWSTGKGGEREEAVETRTRCQNQGRKQYKRILIWICWFTYFIISREGNYSTSLKGPTQQLVTRLLVSK